MKRKNWLLIAVLALVVAVVSLAGCGPSTTTIESVEGINITSQQEGIWVSGTGEVTTVPDIVNLRLGIEATEMSVTEAQTQATAAMDAVTAALTSNGVVEKDIQTQYFSIRQVTRWDRNTEQEVVTGYRVTNTVMVKVRDTDKVGSIIDAVAEAGGDLIRIDSIDFSVDDPSEYYDDAREEAMADAKAKAEELARLAGVQLGKATYISESTHVPRAYPQVAMEIMEEVEVAMAGVMTPISPGEVEISLTVQVGYAIAQ